MLFVVPLALLTLVASARVTAVEALPLSRLAEALALNPEHADLNAEAARRLANNGRLDQAEALARRAIARSPLEVAAYATLAILDEKNGRTARAARRMALANNISHRDLPMQLWLAHQAILAGRYEAGLSHLDVALRSSARTAPNLMALFVASTAEPEMVVAIKPLLDKEPIWKSTFLMSAAIAGPNSDHVFELTRGRVDPSRADERVVIARLIERLVNENDFDRAWSLYRDARPRAAESSAARLRDAEFNGATGYPPFDWAIANSTDLTGLRQARADGKAGFALALVAQNGQAGEIARQLVRIPEGQHVLQFTAGDVAMAVGDRPRTVLRCASEPNAILANLPPARGGPSATTTRHGFSVPPGCRWQMLSVTMPGGSDADRVPWVADFQVTPAR